jgi:hypothetical protein
MPAAAKVGITRVCVVDTVYTLMLYLFYSSEEELTHTFYFFGNGVAKSIRQKFPSHFYFDESKKINRNIIWLFMSLRVFGYFRWPFLRKAKIMGHDHLIYSSYIIGKRDYTYIEDGPRVLTFHFSGRLYKNMCNYRSRRFFLLKKIANFLISDVRGGWAANNKQCKELILTTDEDVPYIAGKKKIVISLSKLWDNMNEQKRRYILDIYDTSDADIHPLKGKSHIVLTQPFLTDGIMPEMEQVEIYENIIKKYDPSRLVLKPHPRDHINYKKYFPDIFIFDKPIPMQLLSIIGIHFKKAITICSSSISSFPSETEKEWVGSSVHPVLFERYPNLNHNIYI